jgi:hypothetical protein
MLSRRNFLRTTSRIGAGAAGVALLGSVSAQAAPVINKDQAGYQEQPKGSQRCGLCKKFQPPDACTFVSGAVNPNGWCHFFTVTG